MATQMTIDKIIVLVLIVLVIAAVLIFLLKPDILNWIRGLPEYKYGYDEEITPPAGEEAMNLCPVKVAWILEGKKINFCGDEACSEGNLIKSKLLWIGDESSGKIKVAQRDVNDIIGKIERRKVYLDNGIMKKEGKLYEEVKNDLPSDEFLLKLNGAYYYLSNLICRVKEIEK